MGIFKKKQKDAVSFVNYSKPSDVESNDDYLYKNIFSTVKENLDYIKMYQGECWDFVSNEFTLENNFQEIEVALVYYAGLVDQNLLNKTVIDALGRNFQRAKKKLETSEDIYRFFKRKVLTTIGIDEAEQFGKLFNTMLSGDMIIFLNGCNKCLIVGARMYQERQVDKPTTQISVMGSNDSFNENLLTNVSLVRKRIKNPNLIVKNIILGKESNTNVAILYIKGLVDENILKEVIRRLKSTNMPEIVDSGYVENALREKQLSIFPKIYYTERPDSTVANLFEGRVAIFIDSSPDILIAPALFTQFLHSSEDFHQKAIIASFFRLLRFFGFSLSLFLPGLYIIFIVHQSELVPFKLLFGVAGQRILTPLPAYLELFLVMIAFDLLREAGTRMPTALGATLSFVGAIIIGQSSVEAGLISPIIVIVVTVTGIGTMLIPNYKLNITVTVIKYLFTIIATFFGF
ncbi:MAG: spore germination protein, partial [Acholeplasmataceae bacterium]|nr:spore germination protein [Acholeplasmataceae bacterium]